ncbi:MAG: hypothetical protein H7Y10_03755 [Flavobacterium sp.]|nr:hypothetical protein [Flavobacterium sp.]
MHADIKGALAQLDKSWKAFEHRGVPMTKNQVKVVLTHANAKGYKTTAELKEDEVDNLIKNVK